MPRFPTPANRNTEIPTPFGRWLEEWLWQHKTTPGQLAIKLGTSYNTVWYWIRRGSMPQYNWLATLAEITGEPFDDLAVLAGYDIGPAPLRKRPVPPPEDPWAYALRRAEQDTTIDEGMRASLIQWIRDQAAGYDPVAERRRQEQEYGAPIVPSPASAASDKPDETEEAGPLPAHRETPHPATQERRAPRRRQSAPPRSSR